MPKIQKKRQSKPFGSLVRTKKSLRTSFEAKMQLKAHKQHLKLTTDGKKDAVKKAAEEKRLRREDNLKRRAENAKKSEVTQLITNPAKLKRMKKKQMKYVRKV